MGLTLITPPAIAPVTLDELKVWCRIDAADWDAMLSAAIIAATDFVSTALGRQLITAEYELTLGSFPACGPILLPRPPLQSIESVSYRDRDGNTVALVAGTDYRIDLTADPGTIAVVKSWPRTGEYPDAVEIAFTAGYGDTAADVPEKIKIAIKGLAAWWFYQPEAVGGVVGETVDGVGSTQRARGPAPMHVRSLINQARLWALS
jgi:uncharacterized phiE125 gp8 family phage protein